MFNRIADIAQGTYTTEEEQATTHAQKAITALKGIIDQAGGTVST